MRCREPVGKLDEPRPKPVGSQASNYGPTPRYQDRTGTSLGRCFHGGHVASGEAHPGGRRSARGDDRQSRGCARRAGHPCRPRPADGPVLSETALAGAGDAPEDHGAVRRVHEEVEGSVRSVRSDRSGRSRFFQHLAPFPRTTVTGGTWASRTPVSQRDFPRPRRPHLEIRPIFLIARVLF